jgi:hypothetical protein
LIIQRIENVLTVLQHLTLLLPSLSAIYSEPRPVSLAAVLDPVSYSLGQLRLTPAKSKQNMSQNLINKHHIFFCCQKKELYFFPFVITTK